MSQNSRQGETMLLDVGDHVIVSGGTQIHFPFPFFSFAVKSVPMPLRFQTVSELATHINITTEILIVVRNFF